MLLRLITGAGLLALGYYVGKQVGRMESIRADLEHRRDTGAPNGVPPEQDDRPTADDSDV